MLVRHERLDKGTLETDQPPISILKLSLTPLFDQAYMAVRDCF